MKKTNFTVVVVVFMLVFITAFMAKPMTLSAAEQKEDKCFVVGLHGGIKSGTGPVGATQQIPVNIVPQYVRVPQGSCVVWVNWIQAPEIEISFKDGKICQEATQIPQRFTLEEGTGCYVTDFKQQGETSSLRFMNKGVYKYEIKITGRIQPIATGEVTVF